MATEFPVRSLNLRDVLDAIGCRPTGPARMRARDDLGDGVGQTAGARRP